MFRKPEPLPATLKMALYGPAGSGKTFTALLVAEGLAGDRRVAVVDTERGTAFYGQGVPARRPHPHPFDFDVLHTRSIAEVLRALRGLDPARHGVVVIDSISHLWDSCKKGYAGRLTRRGSIPFPAWAEVKRPYRDLMDWLLASPAHVLICGRQAVEYGPDEATGEWAGRGFRMRAEGETAYEPDVLLRLERRRGGRDGRATPVAHVEKDRTGVLAGRTIEWPDYDTVAGPLAGLLGPARSGPAGDGVVGPGDAGEAGRDRRSAALAAEYAERFAAVGTAAELWRVGRELTPAVKAGITPGDLERVRQAFGERLARLRAGDAVPGGAAGAQ